MLFSAGSTLTRGEPQFAPIVFQFDLTIPDKAARTADEMANLLGLTTSERAETGEAIDLRKAYTPLKQAVDEICAFEHPVRRTECPLVSSCSDMTKTGSPGIQALTGAG